MARSATIWLGFLHAVAQPFSFYRPYYIRCSGCETSVRSRGEDSVNDLQVVSLSCDAEGPAGLEHLKHEPVVRAHYSSAVDDSSLLVLEMPHQALEHLVCQIKAAREKDGRKSR
jgi:hypothetical protein